MRRGFLYRRRLQRLRAYFRFLLDERPKAMTMLDIIRWAAAMGVKIKLERREG